MRVRLQNDIERLKKRVISLGTIVEERLRMAVKAVEYRDVEQGTKVVEGDLEIDQLEVDLEEECLKILALHQPVADQLRFIIAVLKMNNDLERIGDLAVNIAEYTELIAGKKGVQIPFDFYTMCQKVQGMVKKSLDALVNLDVDLAYQVCVEDDEVDLLKGAMQRHFIQRASKDDGDLEALIDLFLASRHLERIADHSTNIAEDVIYMITGQIHRHRGGEYLHTKTRKPRELV